jgi:hypothetical protein
MNAALSSPTWLGDEFESRPDRKKLLNEGLFRF